MEFSIEYYEALNGRLYAKEFLDDLEQKNKELWKQTVGLIRGLKNRKFHEMPYSRPLGSGLFEIRPRAGKHICRVNYCFGRDKKIVLLNGFVKNNKKTQEREIQKARKLMMQCKERSKKHG